MSNPAASTAAEAVKVKVVQPYHEVDGTVLKVGFVYEFPTSIAESLIVSGAVKKEA